jgi:VCBS repeat-containing protein
MNFSNRLSSTFAGLLAVAGALALTPVSHATAIFSTAVTVPATGPGQTEYFENAGQANPSTLVNIGLFSFPSYASLDPAKGLVGLSVNLTITGLDVNSFPNVGQDLGNIDLAIDGIDTGIVITGFNNTTFTGTIVGDISASLNATLFNLLQNGSGSTQFTLDNSQTAVSHGQTVSSTTDSFNYSGADTSTPYDPNEILANGAPDAPSTYTTATTAGQLVLGLIMNNPNGTSDTSAAPNLFTFNQATVTLEAADVSLANVPFEPSQAIGFGLIALLVGMWYVPQTKEMMKRLLVPAAV